MCRKSCCSSVLSNKGTGERVPSIGRKIGWVRRIGHVKNYRFASKNPSARAVFKRARPRHAVSSAQPRWRTSVLALHQPSLGRRSGLVRMMRHIKISRIWSRNCRARPDSGRARTISGEAWLWRSMSRAHYPDCGAYSARLGQAGSGGLLARQPARNPPARLRSRPPARTARARAHPLRRARPCCAAPCTVPGPLVLYAA